MLFNKLMSLKQNTTPLAGQQSRRREELGFVRWGLFEALFVGAVLQAGENGSH